jgi:ribosomal protein S18 acetylase RimI-like enzyme
MFKINTATESDITAIIQIAERTWWPTYSSFISPEQIRYMLDTIYSPEILQKLMANDEQEFIIVKDEKGICGFASFAPRQDEEKAYKIHKLYVLPEHHGKGQGRLLIDEVKSRISKKNVFTLDLNVNRFNPARFFYEKLGFTIVREEDIPIGPYWMNDFVMRLQLPAPS